jgi:hypothetical protein
MRKERTLARREANAMEDGSPLFCSVYFERDPADGDAVESAFRQFVGRNFGPDYEVTRQVGSLTLIAISGAALSFLTLFCHAAVKSGGKRFGEDVYSTLKSLVVGKREDRTISADALRVEQERFEQMKRVEVRDGQAEVLSSLPAMRNLSGERLLAFFDIMDIHSGRLPYEVKFALYRPSGIADEIKISRSEGRITSLEINRYLPLE